MGQMKTPGVYIVEKSAFPSSVVEVATAVPAFIGYTEKADNKGMSLKNKPWRITSLAEFINYYGYGPTPMFEVGILTKNAPEKKTKKGDEEEKKPGPPPKQESAAPEADFTFGGKDYFLNQKDGPEGP